ncbi:CNDH2 protein, partial [Bucorvus abyssinicus]|nr:CNDH2 protein [Bucorvus abyssinicus]
MEEVESRFLHLLQPIRDLTKNWEVDVAAQLGEYLEELDQICISFDNGKTTMNFVEAALLIQGSACIYSRKVEYLYSLVYQALDFISNKKREKLPSSLGEDGRDADANFSTEEEEFLSLDDIRDSTEVNVDMRKDHQPNAVNIVPLTPMSLVPLEDDEKRDNPLLSRKGELLASRKDFRMNTCTPHATGAFLLELAGLSPTCLQHRGIPGRTAGMGRPRTWIGGAQGAVRLLASLGRVGSPTPVSSRLFPLPGTAGPDNDSREDDAPGAPEDDMETIPAPKEHLEAQRSAPRAKGYVLRERAPAQDLKAPIKEVLDPWQSLDPFSDSEDKPFKKGRPFLVPHSLDDVVGGKRKRKASRKLQDFMKWFSAACEYRGHARRMLPRACLCPDLEVLYWKQVKERVAAQRKLQNPVPVTLCCPTDRPRDLGSLGYEELVRRNVVGARGRGVQPQAGHKVVQQDGWGAPLLTPPLPFSFFTPFPPPQELFIANSQKYAQETELSQHVRRWEERIGPLLQEQAGTGREPGEERATFDIHGYGVALARGCGSLGEWRSFASLVAGQPPFEVCRYMLATLQLANDYVVELTQAPGLDAALDTARLRLLTHQRAHDRFRAFQPPSLCQ